MTFFGRPMRARGGRVAILSAMLSGTLILSALAQTAKPRPTSTNGLAGTMALPPTLHWCSLAWRNSSSGERVGSPVVDRRKDRVGGQLDEEYVAQQWQELDAGDFARAGT